MNRISAHTIISAILLLAFCLGLSLTAVAGEVIRREIEPGVYAIAKEGRTVGIEVVTRGTEGTKTLLAKYLAIESEYHAYRNRMNSFIPLTRLKEMHKRTVLLSVFRNDVIDSEGWHHQAAMNGETLWSLCEWVTGDGKTHKKVVRAPGVETTLQAGDSVLLPISILNATMRRPTPRMFSEPMPELAELKDGLRYASDRRGSYAVYRIKKGETLYSSVVARFTDIRDNADVLKACDEIARRSNIRDIRDIDAGSSVYIPVELLSDRYLPKGNPDRERYESTLIEARRIKGNQGRSRDLSDVVVILDAGHGGKDTGAKNVRAGLYEDEINYDIVCRIRDLLQRETGATVHVTTIDRSTGLKSTSAERFSHDQDEELMTTPRHANTDGSTVSAHLRWMLVNSIYQKEIANGADKNKIVFTSIHTDSLYNSKLRGAMIYIPGAKYRRSEERKTGAVYAKYDEGRSFNRFTSSTSERNRDEAMSRNFAQTVLDELGRKRVKRHDQGDPIRTKIRRSRTNVFVPAVLRNTKVPTKILIETANLENATDRKWLADPWWRQQFARAYVDALKRYYGSNVPSRVARTD